MHGRTVAKLWEKGNEGKLFSYYILVSSDNAAERPKNVSKGIIRARCIATGRSVSISCQPAARYYCSQESKMKKKTRGIEQFKKQVIYLVRHFGFFIPVIDFLPFSQLTTLATFGHSKDQDSVPLQLCIDRGIG